MSDPKYTLVEYVAADRLAVSNAAKDSFVSEFAIGLRLQADCKADGIRLGSVTATTHDTGTGRTLVTVLLDSGAVLTANLTWVLHGCVAPDALCSHTHAGPAQGGTLPAYAKADCSVPFVGGHIQAQGAYTGFKFTETGAAANAAKSIYQVDNAQVSLLLVNDAETVFNPVWTVDRNGATPTYYTVTPPAIFSGGVTSGTINDQDVSSGIVTKAISPACGQCRLTLSGANLSLLPWDGWMLTIDNTPKIVPASGVSLAATGVANTTYFIYAYWSGSAMALEASTTAPTADARNATRVKTGNATRALVGMARTNASGAWVSSDTQRFVISWFNRRNLSMLLQPVPSGASIASTDYVDINTSTKIEYLGWGESDFIFCHIEHSYPGSGTNTLRAVPYLDGMYALWDAEVFVVSSNNTITTCAMSLPSVWSGYHTIKLFCASMNGVATNIVYSTRIAGWVHG